MSRHLEILVEELSMQTALEVLFQRFLPQDMTYNFVRFDGVENFFARLPQQLKGYRAWVSDEYRIILLTDRDDANCHVRKASMEQTARDAGFATKTQPALDGGFTVVSRLAIEELEAWYFGDTAAIRAAYPGVPATISQKRQYRDPDAIRGGTAEALLRVLQVAGYYKGLTRLPKLEVAQKIAEQLDPARNRSRSFRIFWDTIINL